MKLTKSYFLTLMLLAFGMVAFAQVKNKKIEKADFEFAAGGYSQAAELYKSELPKITKDIKEKGRVLFQIAESYRLCKNYNASLEFYDKCIQSQYDKENAEVYFNYGTSLQEMGKIEDAVVQFKKYKERGGNSSKAEDQIRICEEVGKIKKDLPKRRLKAENMEEWNTDAMDYGLTYSSKKSDEFVFSSSRKGSVTGAGVDPKYGGAFQDLYSVKLDKKFKPTQAPQALKGEGLNTGVHEGAGSFDKDFKTLIFTRCGFDKKDRMGCDLFETSRQGDAFTLPKIIEIPGINRAEDDSSRFGQPCLTADEQYLFFVSNMAGGKGGRDIWYLKFDKKLKKWVDLKNLESINTAGDEYYPYLDEQSNLYFASNGYPGFGGLDIFKAPSTGELTFGKVEHLEAPINSASDDFGFIIDKNPIIEGELFEGIFGCYFTSNREGGKGNDDIWRVYEVPLEFSMTGIAYNKKTGDLLEDCAVSVVASDGKTFTFKTDKNGQFTMTKEMVKGETKYSVEVNKQNFLGAKDRFSTVGVKVSTNYTQEYYLTPIEKDKEYPMPTVLYELAKWDLLINAEGPVPVNSADSLNYLLNILQENPTYIVQLESHTDARNTNEANKILSQKRSQTCVDYLISKGIEKDRLVAKGMGEEVPREIKAGDRISADLFAEFPVGTTLTEEYINSLATNDSKERAHQLNRRTTFRIIGFDYVPKGK